MNQDHKTPLAECSVGQLQKLLRLVTEGADTRKSLASAAVNPTEWRAELGALCRSEAQSSELLLDMICMPGTSVGTLVAIKERAKRVRRKATTDAGRAASMILYHGAIASAYAFHQRKISSLPLSDLAGVFEDLAQALATDAAGGVFRQALKRCDIALAEDGRG